VLEAALYELCANVVEHGYGSDSAESFELWWLRCEHAALKLREDPRCRASGVFVLVDHGREYEPATPPPDFHETDVRRRGRGIGLTIVRSAMAAVRYFPGTACGNVTALVFDPARRRAEEVTNA
jgi:anti-sigma regulatory factor (Ser/Thr protein kinase)